MTLLELKKKVFGMIEELNPDSEVLTDDPDIAAKINEVINQVMFELARIRKLPKYAEIAVKSGDKIDFAQIERACGYEVYQLDRVCGVEYDLKADGTIIKVLQDGTAEIECFIYPERITEKTKDKAYEFELPADVMELAPYGIAADLLKSDVSAEYGRVYAERYEAMLQRLDPRYQLGGITVEGGVYI